MAYPTALDSFTSPTSSDYLNSPAHATQHSNANSAIVALETKLGIGSSNCSAASANQYLKADGTGTSSWETLILNRGFAWWIDGTLAVSASRLYNRYIAPQDLTIIKAWAMAETAPTGASLLIDIYINGTSIWSVTPANRLTIAASATTGTQTSFDTTAISAGDYIDIYIDQVGSTVAGAGLAVTLETTQP